MDSRHKYYMILSFPQIALDIEMPLYFPNISLSLFVAVTFQYNFART